MKAPDSVIEVEAVHDFLGKEGARHRDGGPNADLVHLSYMHIFFNVAAWPKKKMWALNNG